MNKHAKKILDQLIHSYEKSLHSNPFQDSSSRRVMYPMKKYPAYDVADLDIVNEINEAMMELAEKQYITIEFDKEHANHMKRIILNLDHVDEVYENYYGRMERSKEAFQLEQLFHDVYQKIHTEWILSFLKEETCYLKTKGWVHSYVGKDILHIKGLLQVLKHLNQGHPGFIRKMSNALFQNSKYFETQLKSSFLSVVRKYEPICQRAKEDEYDMRESEIFRSLGFQLYPEEFAWKGRVRFTLNNGTVNDTSSIVHGYMINGDTIQDIKCMDLSLISRIVLIENKANYYHYLKHAKDDELVVFAAGHFSPVRKQLYQLLAETEEIYLWSDIDLGGFLMYARLKKEVFPQLKPMHMNKTIFETYQAYAKSVSEEYLAKIKKARQREDLSIFYEVMDHILACGKTLEQEAMIIESTYKGQLE